MPGTGIDLQGRFAGDRPRLPGVARARDDRCRRRRPYGERRRHARRSERRHAPGVGVMELGADLSVGDAITAPVTVGNFLSNLGTHLAPTFSAADDTDCGSITTQRRRHARRPERRPLVEQVGGAGVLGCAVMSVGLLVGGEARRATPAISASRSRSTPGSSRSPRSIPDDLLATLLAQALDLRLLLTGAARDHRQRRGRPARHRGERGRQRQAAVHRRRARRRRRHRRQAARDAAEAIVDAITASCSTPRTPTRRLNAGLQNFIFDDTRRDRRSLLTGNGDPVEDPTDIVVLTDCGGDYGSCTDANI